MLFRSIQTSLDAGLQFLSNAQCAQAQAARFDSQLARNDSAQIDFRLLIFSVVTFDQLARVRRERRETIVEAKMNFFSRFNVFVGLY